MPPAPVIRLMNVKFSPNLGDGLLSECLEAGLRVRGAAAATGSIDLAARTAYGQGMAGRGRVLRLLEAMPPGLRAQAVRAPLALASARRWAPHYARELTGATAMVIGGGNLLSDHDLNFPTKLALALTAARERGLPVAFHACGMAADWSAEGERRLRRALAGVDLRAVFLRDAPSCARWDARFAATTGLRAAQVRDPGLLAGLTWAPPPRMAAAPIGLCVMSPLALRYHAQTSIRAADLLRWYRDLARALRGDGARLRVFTNGAPEDRETLALLAPDLRALDAEIVQPETPAELAAVIAPCAALIAFRMHAVIAAYASRVPVLALKWDDKLDAFLASVGQAGWLADVATLAPEAAAERVQVLAAKGGDFSSHAAVIAEAGADLDRLLAALSPAPTLTPPPKIP